MKSDEIDALDSTSSAYEDGPFNLVYEDLYELRKAKTGVVTVRKLDGCK